MKLLDKAFTSNGDRKQVFQMELQKTLDEYMKFRHYARHAYGFQLEWTRMEKLVNNLYTVWQNVKRNLSNSLADKVINNE